MVGGGKAGAEWAALGTLRRAVVWPSWVVFGSISLAFALGLQVSPAVQYAPFALSLLLFGLPHGAVDHLVPARLRGEEAGASSVLVVVALYLVLGGLYLGLWFVAPVPAFAFFICLTWWHWGTGDLWSLRTLVVAGGAGSGVAGRVTVALVRGGLPMLVPLLAFPGEYRAVAESLVGLFGGGAGGVPGWVFAPTFRLVVATSFFALAAVSLVVEWRAGGPWQADAGETVLLAAFFAVVPPVLAVGLYFCLWHATRHVARLLLLDGVARAALVSGHLGVALGRFARDAAPLTVVALAMLVGLAFLVPSLAGGLPALLAVYLVLISALTLPHVVVVAYMDRREGLWREGAPPWGGGPTLRRM
jgi:Brp/Blh family beta-carotene 15,15'-monooxygenase